MFGFLFLLVLDLARDLEKADPLNKQNLEPSNLSGEPVTRSSEEIQILLRNLTCDDSFDKYVSKPKGKCCSFC